MTFFHDDVIKWKHFPRYWPFVRGIHQAPEFLYFLWSAPELTLSKNREAGDWRRHCAYYDAPVMYIQDTSLALGNKAISPVSEEQICRVCVKPSKATVLS